MSIITLDELCGSPYTGLTLKKQGACAISVNIGQTEAMYDVMPRIVVLRRPSARFSARAETRRWWTSWLPLNAPGLGGAD